MAKAHKPNRVGPLRMAGATLLAITALAAFAEGGVRQPLMQMADAGSIHAAIVANPGLYLWAFVAFLAAFTLDVPVAVLFHRALSPAAATISLLAMSLRLAYAAAVIAALLFFGAGIQVAISPELAGANPELAMQMSMVFLQIFDKGFAMTLVVFGAHLLFLGWLLYRARIVPVWLSGLTSLAGIAYILDNIAVFVAPALHQLWQPVVVVLALSEIVLAFWVLIVPQRTLVADPLDTPLPARS